MPHTGGLGMLTTLLVGSVMVVLAGAIVVFRRRSLLASAALAYGPRFGRSSRTARMNANVRYAKGRNTTQPRHIKRRGGLR